MSICSSFLWIVTGASVHLLAKYSPIEQPTTMAYLLHDNKELPQQHVNHTTVVRTENPDGTITIVTTTVIKPEDSLQEVVNVASQGVANKV